MTIFVNLLFSETKNGKTFTRKLDAMTIKQARNALDYIQGQEDKIFVTEIYGIDK